MRKMFSENQIKGIVNQGELKPITIEQQEPNWAYDITSFPFTTGATGTPIFCRIQQLNQELHIVMIGKVHNDTGSDISVYSLTGIVVTLPEEIASRIYDVQGKTAVESNVNIRISVNYASCFKDGADTNDLSKYTATAIMLIANTGDPNKIFINFGSPVAINLVAGKDTYFESRVSLDLI